VQNAVKSARQNGENPLDAFVYSLTKHVRGIEDRLAEKGKRIIGLENKIAQMVREDADIQKSIKGWMGEPNAPKSIAFGVPYLRDRNGSQYRLTSADSADTEKFEKSVSVCPLRSIHKRDVIFSNGEKIQ